MTLVLGWTLLALSLHYAFRLTSWAKGFRSEARLTDASTPVADDDLPDITVIIPARNEERSIGACLDSVLAADYPSDRLTIIVADDDSSDETATVVRARQINLAIHAGGGAGEPVERLVLLHIPAEPSRVRAHKKQAIERAVAMATGDIILTTDADCIVPVGWPRAMAAAFSKPEVAFVSGPVCYQLTDSPTLFARIQALDFFGLMACGAGGIGAGKPNLANGANVAYRRRVFDELGGFSGIDDVTSGDDELLMQKVAYGTGYSVRFCSDAAALVETEPVRTVKEFIHQRRRWASKGTHYPPQLQIMLLGVVSFFGLLVASLGAAFFAPSLWPFVVGAAVIKVASDLAVLLPAVRRFRQGRLLWTYPLHALVHAPHTLAVGLMGTLGSFEWKDRVLDR